MINLMIYDMCYITGFIIYNYRQYVTVRKLRVEKPLPLARPSFFQYFRNFKEKRRPSTYAIVEL